MDQLNSLSDDELRQRLRQYGFPNLPITSTTRKVLIKKLRNHINGEQARLRQATSFVTRYSSDEDGSDQETRRQRTTMPPPRTAGLRSNPPTATKISPRSQSVYVSPVVRHNMHNDSEGDTDHETNNLNSSFLKPYKSPTNDRSFGFGSTKNRTLGLDKRDSLSLYPRSSQFSGYDRSNHSGSHSGSQSGSQSTTSNGHSDELFSDYSHRLSTQYRRSAISTTSRKNTFLLYKVY